MKYGRFSFLTKFLSSPRAFFVLLLFTFGVAFALIRAWYHRFTIQQEIQALKEEVQLLEYKKIESFSLLQYVMSDGYIEEVARTELQMKKPEEQVIVIEPTGGEGTRRPQEDSMAELPSGNKILMLDNPGKWWYYFTRS